MAVLDVRLAGHGVEVGLQGKLHVVPAGLHLKEETHIAHRGTKYVRHTNWGNMNHSEKITRSCIVNLLSLLRKDSISGLNFKAIISQSLLPHAEIVLHSKTMQRKNNKVIHLYFPVVN